MQRTRTRNLVVLARKSLFADSIAVAVKRCNWAGEVVAVSEITAATADLSIDYDWLIMPPEA